jgi:NADH-ubiquinone oxidoreductase chain 1
MTEHSAVIFVFFFLAEYASIVLICILTSILYLGGYNLDVYGLVESISSSFIWLIEFVNYIYKVILTIIFNLWCFNFNLSDWAFLIKHVNSIDSDTVNNVYIVDYNSNGSEANSFLTDPKVEGILYSLIIGLKTFIMIFVFIWVRASFPRIRFDQLMSYCWTILLPLVFAFVLLVPCILYIFEIIPSNVLFY